LVVVDGVSHKSTLSHKGLSICLIQAEPKVRQLNVLVGVSSACRTLKINNADIHTLRAALLERMYYCKVGAGFEAPPVVSSQLVRSRLNGFRNRLSKCFGPRPFKHTPEEFVEMFQGRKKTIYTNALQEFYSENVQQKHAICTAFVKCEKVNPDKAPRCIQPRTPIYNVGVGCYLKHIEHRIYNAIARVFGEDVVVAKGVNVQELGRIIESKWNRFSDPVAVGMDATKFDMHVSAEMLQWEHGFYNLLYDHDPELKRLLRMQINNRGVGRCVDGTLRYQVKGRRFSGDMNTALGNCLIMCGMVWSYARERGIPIKFINNGDDCVVFMERHHYQSFIFQLETWFLDLGFRMIAEPPVYVLEKIEFCQMRCLRTSNGPVMVRNFDSAREKDSASFLPLATEKETRKWLWAVGECGLALTGGVPVFQEFYKWYMRHGVVSNVASSVQMQAGAQFLRQRLLSRESVVTTEARVSFYEAWGVTPEEQIVLEEYYAALPFVFGKRHIDNYDEAVWAPL
jgi:hypothetical protein